ncbi:MAG: transcription-repair coupling factor [Acidibacillus sp.]|uniref:Transcription-repair-coupling factor n=1 Tax=Sulfoacidibacillus ferrooxidans TaxID=2005001 RepID=A0A9X1V7V4_9BACL|nr:transcription-repair coupling factor [Sulfoacidibacillus ferrooxidans]MCI0182614.1 Transcription-repair-coupling factor [Sulfoacidibacillus ferrooxidans]MCY0894114.1 transcription-repair coupling factor [Acidibacillus sp.]
MQEIVHYFSEIDDVMMLRKGLVKKGAQQVVVGLDSSARHLLYASLALTEGQIVIVTHSMQVAETIVAEVGEWLGDWPIYLFPERELSHSDFVAYSPELAALRMETLAALHMGTAKVVVTTIRALRQATLPKSALHEHLLHVVLGQQVALQHILHTLVSLGYERADMVETRGQFSVRGGIVDVYPLFGQATRLEWFDDEIDSIRYFDAETQRSSDQIKEVTIWPVRELIASLSQMTAVADRMEAEMNTYVSKLDAADVAENVQKHVGHDIARMREGIHFPGLIRYANRFYHEHYAFQDYISQDAVMIYDEPSRLRETMERISREEMEWTTAALEHGEMLPGLIDEIYVDSLFHGSSQRQVFVTLLPRQIPGASGASMVNFTVRSMPLFHGQLPLLKTELGRFQKTHQHVVFLAGNEERAERLLHVLEDFSIDVERRTHFDSRAECPTLMIGGISSGFELPAARLVIITENEIFVNRRRARKVRSDASEATRIKSYQDLNIGDFVVHSSHGIAEYMGIETLEIGGVHRDYLNLRYAGNDKLYVPIDQIHLIQKYLGSEEKEPRVHHLGGSDWTRTKSKVQKTVRDIAQDLIKLYAKRESAPGYAFKSDTEWQRDFESMFAYEETPDQLRAIEDIKKDMEKSRPMDRLLCGDVGYGKTEVAIRAASKAVFDGKQVAVLVPTTILAQQHYETFRERFAGFPVTIEVLSRFRTKGETTKVLEGIEKGIVDIVIGTHRLLQKNIKFKDLGLLIVDEEQRFGVTHKEKLKQLRANVDCLTLTATPIPRTLHMSMVGVRDLSVIETPPENRFPVQTYVVEYNDALLREAIEREIGRGGQVYVLYNQVNNIQSIADRVARLVPEARVGIGHGQMAEDELERAMLDFLQGETDVLVSTTIIETGLDIPNVNTLIVFHANRMGLSQLYQLRGRVGRSNRIAYAYFTYQPDKVLSEVAEKRLQAIKEFTELGSGFKIAMRDLAIRGAGNILGAEQHGHIGAVGFDMYTEMLAEAVRELRGEVVEEKADPIVEITVDAFLPETYVAEPSQKVELYKKMIACRTLDEVADLRDEIEDRFGTMPEQVENLLSVAKIRAYAIQYDLASVVKKGTDIHISIRPDSKKGITGESVLELIKLFPKRMGMKSNNGLYLLMVEGRGIGEQDVLQMVLRILEHLGKLMDKQEELQNVQ